MTKKKLITKPINYAIINQLSTDFETQFVPQTELFVEQAFWFQYSVQTNEPNLSAPTTIVEVPKKLPKVSMAQAKDIVILKLKEKLRSLNGDVNERNVKREVEKIETLNIELDHKEKVLVITALKEQLNKLKGKAILTETVSLNLIDPELLKVDVAPLVLKLCKNRTAHTDYIRHTQEEAATIREIVESERLLSPLNTSLDYVWRIFTIVGNVCPLTRIATPTIMPPREPIPIVNSTNKPVVTLVRLKVPVRRIRTDNGTEFVNQTLLDYYEEVGISHETSVARSPQQNGVIERRNHTLIEAARMILGHVLNEMTPGTISSGLVQTSSPSTSYVPPSKK
nr:putative ribonuclease H-like domain-containing protein [Tanacetum cinerariifolium]